MSDFKTETGKSISEAFQEFHKNNPKVYELIKREAWKAVRTGTEKFSIKQICGWIRWNVRIRTTDLTLFDAPGIPSATFKINDAYTAHYSRMLTNEIPEMLEYVEQRELRAL